MMIKVCPKCDTEKSLDSFHKSKANKDGLQIHCKECKKKGYCPDKQASRNLQTKFGITLEDYDRMLEDQGGCCKVCGADEPGGGKSRFSVDHNHSTGKVRGLLCNGCNTGLGLLQDSPEVLAKALTYLLEQGHYGD